MPSPDVRGYVDLTIYDKDAQTLYENAMSRLQTDMPDWEPREGNVETLMLEAFAFVVSELLFSVNRLPGAMTEILLQLFDIYRDYGTQPIVDVVFTAMDDTGGVAPTDTNPDADTTEGDTTTSDGSGAYIVPAGTSLLLSLEDSVAPLTFTTDQEVVIPPGSRTNPLVEQPDGSLYYCPATCTEFSIDANPGADGATPVGAYLSIMDSFSFLNSARIVAVIREGRIEEDDGTYFARASQVLRSMSVALAVASQFEAECIGDPAVNRVLGLDDYNPPMVDEFRGGTGVATNRPGDNQGHITVALWGPNGQLGDQDLADIRNILMIKSQLNLQAHVIDAEINDIDVTATVIADQYADPDVVRHNAELALREYLSAEEWDWSLTVRRNAVIAVLGRAIGVAYVDSLTITHAVSGIPPSAAGDVALIGTYRDDGLAVAPLAIARNINITVISSEIRGGSWAGVAGGVGGGV